VLVQSAGEEPPGLEVDSLWSVVDVEVDQEIIAFEHCNFSSTGWCSYGVVGDRLLVVASLGIRLGDILKLERYESS
jgi:hypothetical protein